MPQCNQKASENKEKVSNVIKRNSYIKTSFFASIYIERQACPRKQNL